MLSGYPDLPESARQSVDALVLKAAGGPADLLKTITGLLRHTSAFVRSELYEQSRALVQRSEEILQHSKQLHAQREKNS
jgi:hypothetical protein